MLQISNQRYDYVRDQLTNSFKHNPLVLKSSKQTFCHQKKQSVTSYQEENEFQQQGKSYNENGLHDSVRSHHSKTQARMFYVRTYQTQKQQNFKPQKHETYNTNAIVIIQKNIRRFIQIKKYRKKQKQARQRRYVIHELYEIEANYIGDLDIIVNYLILKVRTLQLLTEDEIQQCFLNIEQILLLNQKFFDELKTIKSTYQYNMKMSDNLKKFVPFFMIYYDYCSRFQLDQVTILREQNDAIFGNFITQIEDEGFKLKGLNLEAFLVKPVQQLPRYVLLFSQLLKFTEVDHQDYEGIKSILDQFIRVNNKMDLMMSTTKQNLKLLSTYGTTDQTEIDQIKKKKLEEQQNLHNLQQNIRVKIMGTYHYKDGISRFILYIIEFQIKNYRFRTFQRYSQLICLRNAIHTRVPLIVMKPLDRTDWFKSAKELIKVRSAKIKDYLQDIFQQEYAQQYQDLLTDYLDLPDNFFDINIDSDVRIQELDDQQTQQMVNIKGTQLIKISRNTFNFTRNSQLSSQFLPIEVQLPDGTNCTVEITQKCRCIDLIETISRSIKLEQYIDFKLLVSNSYSKRILDDSEVVLKVLSNYNQPNGITKLINYAFTSSTKPILILKKCLYLSNKQECQDYLNDRIRLNLMTHQTLSSLRSDKFKLNIKDYYNYVPFYLFIKHNQIQKAIYSQNSIPFIIVKQIVPPRVLLMHSEQIWNQNLYQKLTELRAEISKHKQQMQKEGYEFTSIQVASILFLQSISQQALYGVKIFKMKVVTTQQSLKMQLQKQIYFGVSYRVIQFFDDSMKLKYVYPLKDIMEVNYSDHTIEILVINLMPIKLKSKDVFDIQRLLEEYKQIQMIQDQLFAEVQSQEHFD